MCAIIMTVYFCDYIWFVTSEKKNCFVLLSSGSAAVFEPISGSGSAAAFVNQAAVAAAPLL